MSALDDKRGDHGWPNAPAHPLVSAAVRDGHSAAFFDAASNGRLLIKRCRTCGNYAAPEAGSCSRCRGADLAHWDALGQGSVVSWTVMAGRAGSDGVVPEPVVAGIVELDEGPWMSARLMLADSEPSVDLRVTVAFVRSGEEVVPTFVDAAPTRLVQVDEV